MLLRASATPALLLWCVCAGSACSDVSRDEPARASTVDGARSDVSATSGGSGTTPGASGVAGGTPIGPAGSSGSTLGMGGGGAPGFAGMSSTNGGVSSLAQGGKTSGAGLGGGAPTAGAMASAGGRPLGNVGGQGSVAGSAGALASGGAPGSGMAGMPSAGMAGSAAGAAPMLPATTFTQVYNDVFLTNCLTSSCHNNSRTEPYFGSKQRTYDFFVQPNVIFPGEDPNYSEIYIYMAWGIMPPSPKPNVPQDQLDLVAGWIGAGALNN